MMSKELERRLAEAVELAKTSRHEFVTLEHILLALTDSPGAVQVLTGSGVNVQKLKKDLRDLIKQHCHQITPEQLGAYGGYDQWQPEFTLACHRLFQRAALQVQSAGKKQITEGHLLVSLFYEQDSHAVFALAQQGISQFDIVNFVSHGTDNEGLGEGIMPSPAVGNQNDIDGMPVDESKQR